MAVDKSSVLPGSRLRADSHFSCIIPGAVLVVEVDASGLFVPCDVGHHYLDGQLSFEGNQYIGFELEEVRQKFDAQEP